MVSGLQSPDMHLLFNFIIMHQIVKPIYQQNSIRLIEITFKAKANQVWLRSFFLEHVSVLANQEKQRVSAHISLVQALECSRTVI